MTHPQGTQISGEMLVEQFFNSLFNALFLKVAVNIMSKEDFDKLIDSVYEENKKQFESIWGPRLAQDLGSMTKLKKLIDTNYEITKQYIDSLREEKVVLS